MNLTINFLRDESIDRISVAPGKLYLARNGLRPHIKTVRGASVGDFILNKLPLSDMVQSEKLQWKRDLRQTVNYYIGFLLWGNKTP